jgi:hypothetical protein
MWLKASDTSAHLLTKVRMTKAIPAMPTDTPTTDVAFARKVFFLGVDTSQGYAFIAVPMASRSGDEGICA